MAAAGIAALIALIAGWVGTGSLGAAFAALSVAQITGLGQLALGSGVLIVELVSSIAPLLMAKERELVQHWAVTLHQTNDAHSAAQAHAQFVSDNHLGMGF